MVRQFEDRVAPVAGFYLFDVARESASNASIKATLACVGGITSWAMGAFDKLLCTLLLFLVIDFCLGFYRGWRNQAVSGSKMKGGVVKIVLYGVAIVVGYQLDGVLAASLHASLPLPIRDCLALYLVLNESISILEHLSSFGVPLPQALLKRLRVYRDNLCVGKK